MGSVSNFNPSKTYDPIDSLEENFRKVFEYVMAQQAEKNPSRFDAFVSKTGKMIEQHPFAAAGIAFGAGYLFTRMFRR